MRVVISASVAGPNRLKDAAGGKVELACDTQEQANKFIELELF